MSKPLASYGIPVEQMDTDGRILARFRSIREAELVTGIKGVCACCRGKRPWAGDYLWRYAGGVSLQEVRIAYKNSLKGFRNHSKQPGNSVTVRQYTNDEVFVAEYPFIAAAERDTGIKRTAINQCCLGRCKTAGGYLWRRALPIQIKD